MQNALKHLHLYDERWQTLTRAIKKKHGRRVREHKKSEECQQEQTTEQAEKKAIECVMVITRNCKELTSKKMEDKKTTHTHTRINDGKLNFV